MTIYFKRDGNSKDFEEGVKRMLSAAILDKLAEDVLSDAYLSVKAVGYGMFIYQTSGDQGGLSITYSLMEEAGGYVGMEILKVG